jgi:hypothetical protein
METLLGHGEFAGTNGGGSEPSARKTRGPVEWLPSEGGPLTMPGARPGPTLESGDASRFGVESLPQASAKPETSVPPRERELAWKLHELLASPYGEGIARIVEETYRLLPQPRPLG